MATQLEIQKRNLESAILFMQQEHAQTLRCLHEEIGKLQKKCSELTFQLTMQSSTELHSGDGEKLKHLEEALSESELARKKAEQEAEVSSRTARLAREQLHVLERQLADEMKSKNQRIAVLTAEVDTQSNSIAYLTTELRKAKVALHGRPTSSSSSSELNTPRDGDVDTELHRPTLRSRKAEESASRSSSRAGDAASPQPPAGPPPMRQTWVPGAPAEPRGIVRRRVTGRQPVDRGAGSPIDDAETLSMRSLTPVPDPAPFLERRQQQHHHQHLVPSDDIVLKPTPPVLPPIRSAKGARKPQAASGTDNSAEVAANGASEFVYSAAGQATSGHSRRGARLLRLAAGAGARAAGGEVSVLAVERVPTTTASQPYAHESGRTD